MDNIEKIYQFKIILLGSKPEVWRRIQVPEHYNFWQLHVAIQDSMGWEDCHLHQFITYDSDTESEGEAIGCVSEIGYQKIIDENKTKISEYFSSLDQKMLYEYDFGDGWEHGIVFEKIINANPIKKYPRCIAGRRTCPPEDCGGIWGYVDLLEIMKNPKHPEYEERIEWLGGKFDSDGFKPKLVIFTER